MIEVAFKLYLTPKLRKADESANSIQLLCHEQPANRPAQFDYSAMDGRQIDQIYKTCQERMADKMISVLLGVASMNSIKDFFRYLNLFSLIGLKLCFSSYQFSHHWNQHLSLLQAITHCYTVLLSTAHSIACRCCLRRTLYLLKLVASNQCLRYEYHHHHCIDYEVQQMHTQI